MITAPGAALAQRRADLRETGSVGEVLQKPHRLWQFSRQASSASGWSDALKSLDQLQAMIAEVKGARLLQGLRGQPAADPEALEDALVRVSYLAMHIEGYLAELDINLLMVLPSVRE
jgi:hypothetical protein